MRKLRQPFSYRFTTVKALFHKHDQIDQSFLVPWIKQNIYFFKCLIVAIQKCWQLFGTAWKLSTRERDGREEQWCNNKRFNHYCDLHEKTYSTWHRGAMCKAKPHHLFHMSACLRSKRNPPPKPQHSWFSQWFIAWTSSTKLPSHIQQSARPASNDYSIYNHIFATYSQRRTRERTAHVMRIIHRRVLKRS